MVVLALAMSGCGSHVIDRVAAPEPIESTSSAPTTPSPTATSSSTSTGPRQVAPESRGGAVTAAPSAPSPSYSGATMMIDGVLLRPGKDTFVSTAIIGESDPRVLTLRGGVQGYGPPDHCVPHTEFSAEQSASRIVVTATFWVPLTPEPEACAAYGSPSAVRDVRLDAAVGRRQLVNKVDHPLYVLDASTLLQPSHVPDGYDYRGVALVLNDYGRGVAHAARFWEPSKGISLQVQQSRTAFGEVPEGADRLHETTIDDRPAVVWQTPGSDHAICLSMISPRAGADVGLRVCTQGNPAPLTPEQLVEVAQSLQLPE